MSVRPRVYANQGFPSDTDGIRNLKETCDITIYDEVKGGGVKVSKEEFLQSVKGVDAIFLAFPCQIYAEVLDAAGPQLKVIGTFSVGLDHIDLKECAKRGVKVGYTPDVLTDAVAEATVGLTIATARRYKEGMNAVANGTWLTNWENCLWNSGKDIKNSAVGIVGLGRIGLGVAKRLQPFGVSQILYCGKTPKDHAKDVGAKYVSFPDLLAEADVVIATCSVSKENHKLFNADAFKKMKRSAIFVNASRGALVDQEDLYKALVDGEILAAGLDVTSPEPLPTDHPLIALPNCTITPHIGSASVGARHAMADLTARNILAGLNGDPLPAPAPL